MTMNPVSAFTGATVDRILDDDARQRLLPADHAGSEGHRRRDRLSHRAVGEDRNAVARKLGAFKTSMLQDVEAGKPLEIDALLTVVREIAQRVNVPAPNLEALLGLTRVFARSRGLYPS